MRISGCGHLLTAFLFIFSASIEFTVRHRETQSMQAHDILANDRRIVAHVCEACNHRFASRFAYDQHRRSYRLIGTACYTGDNQHLELLSSQRSNISTAVLRIGHSRSRQSQLPSICRIIIDMPHNYKHTPIKLHSSHNSAYLCKLCLGPGSVTKPDPGPRHNLHNYAIFDHLCGGRAKSHNTHNYAYYADVQSRIIRIIRIIMRIMRNM